MTAKEYLRDIARREEHIKAKKQRLATLKNIAKSPSSPNLSGMPKSTNMGSSSLSDAVIKYMELEVEIQTDEKKLEEKKVYILDLIGTIGNTEYQTILIKRYFEKKSWMEISNDLFYTKRWSYKLHGFALEDLNQKM